MSLKNELGKAYYILGSIYLQNEWNFNESRSSYQNCLDIMPGVTEYTFRGPMCFKRFY